MTIDKTVCNGKENSTNYFTIYERMLTGCWC